MFVCGSLSRRMTSCCFLLTLLSTLSAGPALAGPISLGTFYQFGFADIGDAATGCDPADPSGPVCVASSGTPTTFLDAPPWTFTAPSIGALLSVTDSLASGDRFEVFDFGVSLGLTSAPTSGFDCGDDPVPCLADPNTSSFIFTLAPGDHSITLAAVEGGFGTGFLRADPTPEPATVLLVGIALGVVSLKVRMSRKGGTE